MVPAYICRQPSRKVVPGAFGSRSESRDAASRQDRHGAIRSERRQFKPEFLVISEVTV